MNLARIILTLTGVFSFAGAAPSATLAPPRAVLVADHLKSETYQEILPDIKALRTLSSNGVELIVVRISGKAYKFDLVRQSVDSGETVEQMGERTGALIAINGGFFSIGKNGQKIPVGLFSKNNKDFSKPWQKTGGYLVFRDGDLSILPTVGQKRPIAADVLQSKPTLIEPGGKWAMNTNGVVPKKRTLVCKDRAGDLVLLSIVAGGLSLYEAGWLMRGRDVGGVFGCDSAIAMDGGGSTQIWVKNRPDLSFAGDTPVHNGVVVLGRE